MDEREGLHRDAYAPRAFSISTDDDAVVRRTKSLAATGPIHDLDRTKSWMEGDYWDDYDLPALALSVIDQVALLMGISVGMTYDAALEYTGGQAARQRPASDESEWAAVATRVLSALIGTEPFTQEYVTYTDDQPVRRVHSFRILYEQWSGEGTAYLRATEEAINVLVGGLDIDIESAQIAAEAQLKALIARGALTDAAQFAEVARYRTITYLEHIRTIVRDTLVDPDAHDWLAAVPAEIKAALEHVGERLITEQELLAAIADKRDGVVDPATRAKVNRLLATVNDCMSRHAELQSHLIGARQALRDAQDERFARRRGSMRRFSLDDDLIPGLLQADRAGGGVAADAIFTQFSSILRPFLPYMDTLVDDLLEASGELAGGEAIDDPVFDDDQAEPWWAPYWDMADTLLDALVEPVTLSQLLARVATMDELPRQTDGEPLSRGRLAAVVCHVAFGHLAAPLCDQSPGARVLVATPTGGPAVSTHVVADDLLLTPARIAPDPRASAPEYAEEGMLL